MTQAQTISNFNSMEKQALSLPAMISELIPTYLERVNQLIDAQSLEQIERIYLFGSGDSNFVGLSVQYAFESIAGVPMEILSSLKFSRYSVRNIPQTTKKSSIAIGISVSGTSSRTQEGIISANDKGIRTIALTANKGKFTDLATASLIADSPDFPDPEPNGTPGVRSFVSNHLILLLLSIRIGERRRNISHSKANELINELTQIPNKLELFIKRTKPILQTSVSNWKEYNEYVFVGAGPNYGSALFSAAKLIESGGDFAVAQETEEWAHLNYYNREKNTPTILISGGKEDYSRTREILSAAKSIGRQTMLIGPIACYDFSIDADFWIEIPPTNESIIPIYICALSSLMASFRSDLIGEIYFRENNSVETSKIRSSAIISSK